MQHELFRSGHDLDLRSNFQHNLLRSNNSSFVASRQKEHDAGEMNVVPLQSQVRTRQSAGDRERGRVARAQPRTPAIEGARNSATDRRLIVSCFFVDRRPVTVWSSESSSARSLRYECTYLVLADSG